MTLKGLTQEPEGASEGASLLTLQNFIYKHTTDSENVQWKNKMKRIILQAMKLTQTGCQNLFISTTDYL